MHLRKFTGRPAKEKYTQNLNLTLMKNKNTTWSNNGILFFTSPVATETFKKFDKRGQDKISTNDLGPAFSALKVSIKPDLLKEWADEVDDDGKST